MRLFKTVDEKFEELGFKKTYESKSVIEYTKFIEKFNFTHCIEILYKADGRHIALSYQQGINNDGFNNAVGLTYLESKLIYKKMKQMGWKSK